MKSVAKLKKALEVLEKKKLCSISDVARELKISRNSAKRLLNALSELGFVKHIRGGRMHFYILKKRLSERSNFS